MSYRRIPDTWIDATVRRLAEQTVRAVAIDLGIPVPGLRWFAPGSYPGADVVHPGGDYGRALRGFVRDIDPTTVYLSAELSTADVVRLAAHETRHAWQGQRPGRVTEHDIEPDAERYASAWMKRSKR